MIAEVDVAQAAWLAHGSPSAGGLPWRPRTGECARCGQAGGDGVDAGKVISDKWAGWDSWRRAIGAWLCPPCVWVYRADGLRAGMFLITRRPTFEIVSPTRVRTILAGPVPAESALVVPLRFNRKHVVPLAEWGAVRVDDVTLRWTRSDAERLAAVLRLRVDGFGGRMLALPSPPWQVLSKVPAGRRLGVLGDWRLLDRWRPAHPGFDLAVLVCRPEVAAGSGTTS